MRRWVIYFILMLFIFYGCNGKTRKKSVDYFKLNMTKGKQALENGNFEDAEDYFKAAIKIKEDDPEAHYGLMLSYVGQVVNELGAIVKFFTSSSSESVIEELAKFYPQGLDLKKMLKNYLEKLNELFVNVRDEADYLETFEYVHFYVEHMPITFNTSALIGEEAEEKLGNLNYLDLGGEWGLIELYWIDGMAHFLIGVLDLIYAHDLNIENIPSLDLSQGFEVFLVRILRENPNFLGPDPDPQMAEKLFEVDDNWGEAFIQWGKIVDEGTVELQHDPDQSNNVVPIYDTNKNGKYDPGDGLGLAKLLPVGINPDIANLFGQIYFSESMGQKVKDTLFEDWKNFLINVGLSLEGKLNRRLTIKDDLNPLLRDLNEKPMDNIVELNLHALFDKDHLEYLRDLLPYTYYDNVYKKAYVFVVEHNDPYMTKEEIVNYARTQTEFAGRITYATPGTDPIWHDVFCLVDQPHFDVEHNPFYQEVKGLEKIPRDCLIDVNQKIIHITYPEDTTVPDHRSLTYIAFKDPTFSGLGCINLDAWSKPEDYFTGIPDPWIPPELKGKGCQPPTQYSLNALFQYFILYFEGQEVEIFGLNLNRLFNSYKSIFSFSPMGR